jgi:hypothetical protein
MYVCMYVCMYPTYLVNYERGTTTTLLPFSLYPNLFSLFYFQSPIILKGQEKKVFDLPHLNWADRTTMTLSICLLYLPITSAIIAYKITTGMCWIGFFFSNSLFKVIKSSSWSLVVTYHSNIHIDPKSKHETIDLLWFYNSYESAY